MVMSDFCSDGLVAIIGFFVGFGISYWRHKVDKKRNEKKQINNFNSSNNQPPPIKKRPQPTGIMSL